MEAGSGGVPLRLREIPAVVSARALMGEAGRPGDPSHLVGEAAQHDRSGLPGAGRRKDRPRLLGETPRPGTPTAGNAMSPTSGAGAHHVPLGLGGDDAGVVWLDLHPGARVVVAGPRESGRTSALAWLADRLHATGSAVAWADPDRPMTEAGGALLVDDADLLDQAGSDALLRRWRDRTQAGPVVVAVRSELLATGYTPVAAALRTAAHVIILAPLRAGTGHVAAADVLPHADPVRPAQPGRGVLVGPRASVPVQLPAP